MLHIVLICIAQNFGGMLSKNIDRLDALCNRFDKIIIIVGKNFGGLVVNHRLAEVFYHQSFVLYST